ncbi:expressed unknown protein [Seminavis robusta]|uniref:Uncharacterized protein n=1 Tax=Seminavis robusta TaxID=568900 RepID=A0A9N8EFU0_9STRA|nr:expressed unknown protein [Seminavis robusta]|eukprot:Sro873_g214080.1 n/a (124) ;mRNA; r:33545-34063
MADGFFHRLNAAMLQTGNYSGQLSSFVGKVKNLQLGNQTLEFEACDGGIINMDLSSAEMPEQEIAGDLVWEVMGIPDENNGVTLFVMRELSSDTKLDLYNKMLPVLHNPKFANYFVPAGVGGQ